MNRLAQESSPYLLQHRDNPVNWYPWCAEALDRARHEDKPIFLSIGYSACHWCHVMEHESFEDAQIAALLNEHFIAIKVDREERPDLDHIYMQAVQMITGRGGWPLSAFLTPDLQPFYGGTYWPPTQRMGMPGFDQVLRAVTDAWTNRRAQALAQAQQLTAAIRDHAQAAPTPGDLSLDLLRGARQRLASSFDPVHGGFGRAPKFPRPIELQLLLRLWSRTGDPQTLDMVCLTLDKMASGGMYDHLAGGFARYSVDEQWLVPHFEKMLYDNALLADAYLDGYLATGQPRYRRVVQETLDYVLRDMRDPAFGFHSTEDADSEGEEGKYYVWTVREIHSLLGTDLGVQFCAAYGVTETGNFEGRSILHLTQPLEQAAEAAQRDPAEFSATLADARSRLLAHRQQRVRPGKDDKILVSWNALMIHTMARAAGVLEDDRYLHAAQQAAQFLLTHLRREDGRLLHCWRHGQAKYDAYLDDYAYLVGALVSLYEADFQEHWLDTAATLADTMLQRFSARPQGGFYFTADDHETLVARTREWYDASVPSGNGMAATALMRLGKLTGRPQYLAAARSTLEAAAAIMQSTPEGVCQALVATDLLLGPTWELALLAAPAGDRQTEQVLRAIRHTYLPRSVLAVRGQRDGADRSPLLDELFTGKQAGTQPCLYVCQDFTCQAPRTGVEEIDAWLNERR